MMYRLSVIQGTNKPIVLDNLETPEEAISNGTAYLGLTYQDYYFDQSLKYLLTNGEIEFTVGKAGKKPETILIEVV